MKKACLYDAAYVTYLPRKHEALVGRWRAMRLCAAGQRVVIAICGRKRVRLTECRRRRVAILRMCDWVRWVSDSTKGGEHGRWGGQGCTRAVLGNEWCVRLASPMAGPSAEMLPRQHTSGCAETDSWRVSAPV